MAGGNQDRSSTITSRSVVVSFADAAQARLAVAGLPAAARALHRLAGDGLAQVWVTTPDAWDPGEWLAQEAARLAPATTIHFTEMSLAPADLPVIDGANLVASPREIIKATAKPGDGIVSRHINRRISQACTGGLLRLFPRLRPVQATWGTALLALAMITALLTGTQAGLVTGALLFQAASIFDGVDGEIARATFRTSPQGAALDSLVDALTNLACVAGVAWNLHRQGQDPAALAGAVGLVTMGLGLALIGRRSRKNADGMTFNAVKEQVNRNPSPIRQWLTWLTMRDFYALAGALLIALGFAHFALYAFAVVAMGWFVVVVVVLARDRD